MADKENIINYKDALKKYEFAALAGRLTESKERVPYALVALRKHYAQYEGLEGDEILAAAFNDAAAGLKEGNITSSSVMKAIKSYSEKYLDAATNCRIGDLINYNLESGLEIPENFMRLASRHNNKTLEEIAEEAKKKDPEASRLILGIQTIEDTKFEAYLYPKLVKENTEGYLNELGDKEEKQNNERRVLRKTG